MSVNAQGKNEFIIFNAFYFEVCAPKKEEDEFLTQKYNTWTKEEEQKLV